MRNDGKGSIQIASDKYVRHQCVAVKKQADKTPCDTIALEDSRSEREFGKDRDERQVKCSAAICAT